MTLPGVSYKGKRVVVTGAASGMGRAATELLVEDGADVHAIDIQPLEGDGITGYQLDLRDSAAVREVAGAIPEPVDVLLNCAGLARLPDPVDVARVNFIGLRRLTEELLAKMDRGGAIGNIASKSGAGWPWLLDEILPVLKIEDDDSAADWFANTPGMVDAYGFSKACVIVYTLARAAELATRGIRMCAISPGAADTGFFGNSDPLANPALRTAIAHVGRMSTPAEQAMPLLFLCSEAASYVSGVSLIVDAGAQGGYITGRLSPPELPLYDRIRRPPPQQA